MGRLHATARAAAPKVDLDDLFAGQTGLATRRQLLAAGLDDEAIRLELRAQRWQRILPGMYANTTGPITLEQRRIAGTLFTCPRSQLTGIAALTWHSFRQQPNDPLIHVLVPHAMRRSSRGFVRVHRTYRLDADAKAAHGYTVCSVARAVADACRGLPHIREVRAIVAESVQRNFTSVAALERELTLAGTSRTALLRRALRDVNAGARSAPEAELQDIFPPDSSIPEILWNPQLETLDGTTLPSPDGWIPEAGIAMEVGSREYHLDPEGWERTMRRHNLLSSYGALVLHFTPSEVRRRRRSVRETVDRACAERIATGAAAAIRVARPGPAPGGLLQ